MKCNIHNGQFSWILKVDNEEIIFQGGSSAEYFGRHYSDLGYEVEYTGTHAEKFTVTLEEYKASKSA